jgi:hypothetical protein
MWLNQDASRIDEINAMVAEITQDGGPHGSRIMFPVATICDETLSVIAEVIKRIPGKWEHVASWHGTPISEVVYACKMDG